MHGRGLTPKLWRLLAVTSMTIGLLWLFGFAVVRPGGLLGSLDDSAAWHLPGDPPTPPLRLAVN